MRFNNGALSKQDVNNHELKAFLSFFFTLHCFPLAFQVKREEAEKEEKRTLIFETVGSKE